jgi:riboflavin transporter FmnP
MNSNHRTELTRWRETLRKMVLSAMFVAIGLILPFFTGQLPRIGNMLLPMHIPVLLCGLVCGWYYGAAVGLILPVARFLLFGMPPLYPTALSMSVELCVYGLTIGLIYGLFRKQSPLRVYAAMIPAMLVGRLAWGGAQMALLGVQDMPFTWEAFLAGAFIHAIPGIILQFLLIPSVMTILHYTGLQRFKRSER